MEKDLKNCSSLKIVLFQMIGPSRIPKMASGGTIGNGISGHSFG